MLHNLCLLERPLHNAYEQTWLLLQLITKKFVSGILQATPQQDVYTWGHSLTFFLGVVCTVVGAFAILTLCIMCLFFNI